MSLNYFKLEWGRLDSNPFSRKTPDLQSGPALQLRRAPLDSSNAHQNIHSNKTESRWRESNPRPADYKSAALPAELHRQIQSLN